MGAETTAELPDRLIEQWDMLDDAGELWAWLEEAFAAAFRAGAEIDGNGVLVHVVPCVPGEAIPAGARITGMKLARIEGRIGLYFFAESAA